MGKEFLKWLASLGTGVATVALAYLAEQQGAISGVDPLASTVAVTLLARLVSFLTAKLGPPKPETPVANSGTRYP